MQYEPEAKIRFYHVKAWQPPTDERKWGRHMTWGVVAESAVGALAVVQREHPECRIDAVNDAGIVHHERPVVSES